MADKMQQIYTKNISDQIESLKAAKVLIDEAIKMKQSSIDFKNHNYNTYGLNVNGTIKDDLKVARKLLLECYPSDKDYD